MMKKSVAAFVVFLMFLWVIPSSLVARQESYIIGKEDVLEVNVWQSEHLTKTVTVEQDGMIDYPFLGKIDASGRSVDELRQELIEKLAQGYVKEPQVSITVKEYNSKKILVFGEVGKPGLYKIKNKMPLLELLFMVGGAKSAKRMTIIRPEAKNGEVIPAGLRTSTNREDAQDEGTVIEVDLIKLLSKGDLSQNVTIFPGDTIYVSEGTGQKFYILGQISNPGPYEWSKEITVLEAIKLADGPTDMAALSRIKLRRAGKGKEGEIRVNMVHIMKGKKKDDVIVRPGDTIIIPRSWI